MSVEAERLLQALEMWEDGVELMSECLRRRMPHASELELALALDRWLAGPDPADQDCVVRAPDGR